VSRPVRTTAGAPSTPDRTHLDRVHDAEAVVEDIAATLDALREDARRTLGVVGDDGKTPPFRKVLREAGVGVYPLTALGALSIVDTFQLYAFTVLTPEISRTLGISVAAFAGLVAVRTLASAVSPLPSALLVQKVARRALVIVAVSVVWGLATLFTGFATSAFLLAAVLVVDGLTTGATVSLHEPLLVDCYPPTVRVRALSLYRAFDSFGNVVSPLLVALLSGVLGFTWRGVFVVFGVICLLVIPYATRLRDPGFGRWDTQRLRQKVHADDEAAVGGDDVELGFFEIVRRLMLVPTVRSLLTGFAVFGMLLVPFATFLAFYLDEQLGLGPAQRGLFSAATASAGIVGLVVYGRFGEQLFRRDPALVVRGAAASLGVGVVLICAALLMPWTAAVLSVFIIASTILGLVGPGLSVTMLSVVPANMRPHLGALIGIFLGGVGGISGAVLLGGMQDRYGTTGALFSLLGPGVLGALLLLRAGRFVQTDLDRMIDTVLEEEQLRDVVARGGHLPMLTCKGIDFSYGQLQVLFGVDFTVDDGEMVALLGTNGAGKSTLLRVISGIGLPQSGTVRYHGHDITYLDAERRTRLGITQIPGGRAVFGPMTVVENIRSYGYSLGKQRSNLDNLVDECFAAFPRLAERRNSLASQLSGGEQQMLGLSKALVLKPRLLIIDELSLGLAPIIVGQLLDMVRAINAHGTAVVLVEQSVNIALSLVDHAYFMEKGEMRFDGVASDLLAREDLLRAVFLEGAGQAQ
jgi:ABC-type branched-subunit amino acid transport system ATPase component/sugar phosphate permease